MKLLVDMNLSPRWIGLLVSASIDAVHWSAVGRADAKDLEIMAYAVENGCIVLTHDLDFSAILAATKAVKPSVVQIRSEDISPDAIGMKVICALRQMEAELEKGVLLTIDPNRSRLRLLPFDREDSTC